MVEIAKIMSPFAQIEGYRWKLEPLLGMSDTLEILKKSD